MAKVHLMIGIQGSGKSTFANSLSKEKSIQIISTDRVRQAHPDWKEELIWPEVYKLTADNLKQGDDIIFDATNITVKVRTRFLTNVLEHFENASIDKLPFEYIGYLFKVDPKLCMKRVEKRNQNPNELFLPPEVVFSYHERLEEPTYNEPFNKIYNIINNEIIKEISK